MKTKKKMTIDTSTEQIETTKKEANQNENKKGKSHIEGGITQVKCYNCK